MPARTIIVLVLLGFWSGCAKQAALPDIIVKAATPEEYAQFRADLGAQFPPEQLQPLDVATQELKLDALNRGVPAAGRDADMCAKINGRTVQVAMVLGWRARRERFLREIAEVRKILEAAQEAKDRAAASGAPLASSVPAQIQSAATVLDQVSRNLAETERQLARWARQARTSSTE